MKSDFLLAITQISAEKNLPKEVIISAIEAALVSAYKKDNFTLTQTVEVKLDPNNGKVEVWAEKTVVDIPYDKCCEISLDDAHKIEPELQIGDTTMVEDTPPNAGRIAAQTAKQVILQRLHEAEHSAIFEEYINRESEVVTGTIQRIELGQVYIDIGRTEGILPVNEQMRNERYRIGQRLKVLLLQVIQTGKGPRVVISRSHPDLLRRLFELEVPEIYNGTVEIKALVREAGYRSKVAVTAHQGGIDPVGCCVGLRGIRIQNIVSELNSEKIDVVMWNSELPTFIANALSPAQIVTVELNKEEEVATVIVPDKQLSLAIGKEGQNARLAAKLTGWRIDIKNASTFEAEKLEAAQLAAEAAETAIAEEVATEEELAEIPATPEPVLTPVEVTVAAEAKTAPAPEAEPIPPETFFAPQVAAEKSRLRFAEDILAPTTAKPDAKSKKKKKRTRGKESAEDGIKLKKTRRGVEITEEDEDYI
ncbi:transcription termination factor NusA [Chloroflexota bacterium]